MSRDFIIPKHIITGENALSEANLHYGKKALIVTDPVMVELKNVDKVVQKLDQDHIECSVFSQITGEPTDLMIEKGVEQYRAEDCDFLIAIGGGSPIDSMKAIGAVITNGQEIDDY